MGVEPLLLALAAPFPSMGRVGEVIALSFSFFAFIATQEVEATLEAWVPLIAKTFASELLVP